MELSNVLGSAGGVVGRSTLSLATPSKSGLQGAAGTAPADRVTLSPLARSLHDESLVAFNALSDEQRGQLASLVDSGQLSGEDVHNALKQRLKEARRSAFYAIERMAANDSADLRANGNPTRDTLLDTLGATLKRRSGMVATLSGLERDGQDDTQAYRDLSEQLKARTMNPLLDRIPPDRIGLEFFMVDPAESRTMSTRTEGDAVYKLKATSFDLDALDRALRPIGEKDAASLVREKFGLPNGAPVAKDPAFSSDDAIFAFPWANGTVPSSAASDLLEPASRAKRDTSHAQAVGSIGFYTKVGDRFIQQQGTVYQIPDEALPGKAGNRQGFPDISRPDPVETERQLGYLRGLFAQYR